MGVKLNYWEMQRFDIDDLDLNFLAELLLQGSVMLYPTDTVAGIGCIGNNLKAVQRVYKIKGRDFNKPVSLAFSSIKQVRRYAHISSKAEKLFSLLPGALSLVLPLKNDAPTLFGLDGTSIGVRIPNCAWLLTLLDKTGLPIITTSANLTQKDPARRVDLIDRKILEQIDILIKWQGDLTKTASTVVYVNDNVKILREGSIPREKIIDLTTR